MDKKSAPQLNKVIKELQTTIKKQNTKLHKLSKIQQNLEEANISLINDNIKIKQIDLQKEDFAGMISHELKTPLVPIEGYCEMLSEGLLGTVNDSQKDAIKNILENVEKVKDLIDKMLSAQKLNMKQYTLKLKKTSVKDLMDNCHTRNFNLCKEKNIEFINSTSCETEIFVDETSIQKVFSNLIQNSVDFVSKGGRIEIQASEHGGDFLLFFVKDNGAGISSDKQNNLFRKFYQADSSVTRKHGGTGMGLSICKGIVNAHGGRIWVESEEGKGSCFYFIIPKTIEKSLV